MKDKNTMEELLAKVNSIVEQHGKAAVAERLECSSQAIGKAIKDHDNPFKYFGLRVKILGAYGVEVDGPFFTFKTKLFRKQS